MSDQNDRAEAKEAATRERIARHNGVPLDQVPTAKQQREQAILANLQPVPGDPRNSPLAHLGSTRVEKTYEEKVITRLTAIAWFTGIVGVATAVGLILAIAGWISASHGF